MRIECGFCTLGYAEYCGENDWKRRDCTHYAFQLESVHEKSCVLFGEYVNKVKIMVKSQNTKNYWTRTQSYSGTFTAAGGTVLTKDVKFGW
jgi:hypothetical protein